MTTFSTDIFGLPYPDVDEPPNGPLQIHALASVTETALRQLLAGHTGLLQDGALGPGDCMVTEHAGTPNRSVDVAGGIAIVDNSITVAVSGNVPIAAAHATLPRIDRIVLSAAGAFSALTGTATSGATIDNADSHGAADPSGHGLLVADVRIPATDTTITNDQIRDRRTWARGAYLTEVSDGAGNIAVNNDVAQLFFEHRIECTGAPMEIAFAAPVFAADSGEVVHAEIHMDSTVVDGSGCTFEAASAGQDGLLLARARVTPTAGSHLFQAITIRTSGTSSITYRNSGADRYSWELIELLRQNTANNTATSG